MGSTPNRYTVIRLKKIFTECVDLVFGSKCVQFREICMLQCSTIINTFWVDPHSDLLKKVPVKPKNTIQGTEICKLFFLTVCQIQHGTMEYDLIFGERKDECESVYVFECE